MKEKQCGIYCIENLIDHKKYIGQSVDIYHRWLTHRSDLRNNNHANIHLQRAWNKYGEENFKHYILEECEETFLNDCEIKWINFYNSYKDGYNRTIGGEGTRGFVLSEERKKQISKDLTGRYYSPETRELMRKHILEQFQDETFLSAFYKNIEFQKTPISCYNETGYISDYPDIHTAGRAIKAEPTNICKVLKGKHKTCNGFTFCYSYETLTDEQLKERYKTNQPMIKHSSRNNPIDEIDENGNIIKHFVNAKEISDFYDIDSSSVIKVCRGKLKQTKGRIFKYAD